MAFIVHSEQGLMADKGQTVAPYVETLYIGSIDLPNIEASATINE